jgi:AmmeMemoRadiSam system protein B
MQPGTRPAAVAGSFYPRDPDKLRGAVARHLASADVSAAAGDARPPKLLLVPHAGYVYSGDVAALAYAPLAQWRGRISRIVLLGPVHRVAVQGLAAPTVSAFETPLGPVPLDLGALALLRDLRQVVWTDLPHTEEHALEVQLPFLQSVLGDGFALVPLAVGRASPSEVAEVLERLWGGDETLIVISSDLSHYLPYAQATARCGSRASTAWRHACWVCAIRPTLPA